MSLKAEGSELADLVRPGSAVPKVREEGNSGANLTLDGFADPGGPLFELGLIGALEQQPGFGFGAGIAQQDPAALRA